MASNFRIISESRIATGVEGRYRGLNVGNFSKELRKSTRSGK